MLNKEHGYLNFLIVFVLMLVSVVVISFMAMAQTQYQSANLMKERMSNAYAAESAMVFAIHQIHKTFVEEHEKAKALGGPSPFKTLAFSESCSPTTLEGFTDTVENTKIETCLDEISTNNGRRTFKLSVVSTTDGNAKNMFETIITFKQDTLNNGNITYSILKWNGN